MTTAHSFKVIFTVKQVAHPFTEVIQASNVEHAVAQLKQLIKQHQLTLKQVVAVVEVTD